MVFDCPDSGSSWGNDGVAGSRPALVVVAAARLITPPPMFCGLVVPRLAARVALSTSALLTIAGVQSGWSCTSSADEPATCGVAMLVPWNMAKRLPRTDDKTFTPGAQTSGLISSRLAGPRLEKPARKFWLFVRTSANDVPFAVALALVAAALRMAPRSFCASITAAVAGWSAVPSCPIAAGSPRAVFTTRTPKAPALRALRILVEKVQTPRAMTTIFPVCVPARTGVQAWGAAPAAAVGAGAVQVAGFAGIPGSKALKSPTAAPKVVAATITGIPKK